MTKLNIAENINQEQINELTLEELKELIIRKEDYVKGWKDCFEMVKKIWDK